jgi:malonyl-CoA O-methyltransferase
MKAVKEFSRFASTYGRYNVIQRRVASDLISGIDESFLGCVIDLGCGDGTVFEQLQKHRIGFGRFLGIDLSQEMLALHPKAPGVEILWGDFNDGDFLKSLSRFHPDRVLSSSSLQWAVDLEQTLGHIASLAPRAEMAIFTDGTFKTLHRTAGIDSPIRSFEQTEEAIVKVFDPLRLERVRYRLRFESASAMFRYIKLSGVSGGEARLSYKQARRLMRCYPLDYLEFELLLTSAKSKRSFSRS